MPKKRTKLEPWRSAMTFDEGKEVGELDVILDALDLAREAAMKRLDLVRNRAHMRYLHRRKKETGQ